MGKIAHIKLKLVLISTFGTIGEWLEEYKKALEQIFYVYQAEYYEK